MEAVCSSKTLVCTCKSTWHPSPTHYSLFTAAKTDSCVTSCHLFSATDVNDTLDDDEADPEYNVLADEEKETGENVLLFCQWWIVRCNCDQ